MFLTLNDFPRHPNKVTTNHNMNFEITDSHQSVNEPQCKHINQQVARSTVSIRLSRTSCSNQYILCYCGVIASRRLFKLGSDEPMEWYFPTSHCLIYSLLGYCDTTKPHRIVPMPNHHTSTWDVHLLTSKFSFYPASLMISNHHYDGLTKFLRDKERWMSLSQQFRMSCNTLNMVQNTVKHKSRMLLQKFAIFEAILPTYPHSLFSSVQLIVNPSRLNQTQINPRSVHLYCIYIDYTCKVRFHVVPRFHVLVDLMEYVYGICIYMEYVSYSVLPQLR